MRAKLPQPRNGSRAVARAGAGTSSQAAPLEKADKSARRRSRARALARGGTAADRAIVGKAVTEPGRIGRRHSLPGPGRVVTPAKAPRLAAHLRHGQLMWPTSQLVERASLESSNRAARATRVRFV